jgi:TolB-like protein
MRKTVLLAAALACLCAAPALSAQSPRGEKHSVAVIQFHLGGDIDAAEAARMAERVRREFNLSGRYIVVSMSKTDAGLKGKLAQADCQIAECAVQAGKALSVERVVIGNAARFGDEYHLSARMVDVRSGKTVHRSELRCPSCKPEDLADKASELATMLLLAEERGAEQVEAKEKKAVERPLVGVFTLVPQGRMNRSTAYTLSNVMEDELKRGGKLVVQDRAERDRILDEQGVQMCDAADAGCRVQLAGILNVRQFLAGEASQEGATCRFHLVLAEAQKGLALVETTAAGDCEELRAVAAVEGAVRELVREYENKFPGLAAHEFVDPFTEASAASAAQTGPARGPAPRPRFWTWIAAGAAGAMLASGVGVAAYAGSLDNQSREAGIDQVTAGDRHDGAGAAAWAANGLYIGAGAAAVAAVVLFVVEGRAASPAPAAPGAKP